MAAAAIWALAFLAIFITHTRHALESNGQRRLWHSGHVLMACGMVFMYAPRSLDPLGIANGPWEVVFGIATASVVGLMLTQLGSQRTFSALWLLTTVDLAAMVYMWSPGSLRAPVSWTLASYFATQAWLWSSDRIRGADRELFTGTYTVGAGGEVSVARAQPLICPRDIRVSMVTMALGMAYMVVAMQLTS